MEKRKNDFVTIGSLVKYKTDRDGNPIPVSKQRSYIKVANDLTLKKGMFIDVQKRPTDEEINAAPNDVIAEMLTRRQEAWDNPEWNWPDWKLADLVVNLAQEIKSSK